MSPRDFPQLSSLRDQGASDKHVNVEFDNVTTRKLFQASAMFGKTVYPAKCGVRLVAQHQPQSLFTNNQQGQVPTSSKQPLPIFMPALGHRGSPAPLKCDITLSISPSF
jgi:hypothetical protein